MKGLDAKLYNQDYYNQDCSGFKEFSKSSGKKLYPRYLEVTKHLKIKKGMKILDIGCGRGELSFWAADRGATVIGVDYSKAAIKLANSALAKQPNRIQKKISFFVKNAKQLKYKNNTFDAILLIDVLEHLYPDEQEKVLHNTFNLLKKDGVLIAHTEPSKTYLDITYPFWVYPISSLVLKFWNSIFNKKHNLFPAPKDMRTDSHKIMHINEPTYFNLKRVFQRTGFKLTIISKISRLRTQISWKDNIFNLLVFIYPFSNYFPLNALFADDFIIKAKKK